MDDPEAVVSPGGVGFDINCGVRLLRTSLMEKDVEPVKEQLTQSLFNHIPVGVGSKGIIITNSSDLEAALVRGRVVCARPPVTACCSCAHRHSHRCRGMWRGVRVPSPGAWHGLVGARRVQLG